MRRSRKSKGIWLFTISPFISYDRERYGACVSTYALFAGLVVDYRGRLENPKCEGLGVVQFNHVAGV